MQKTLKKCALLKTLEKVNIRCSTLLDNAYPQASAVSLCCTAPHVAREPPPPPPSTPASSGAQGGNERGWRGPQPAASLPDTDSHRLYREVPSDGRRSMQGGGGLRLPALPSTPFPATLFSVSSKIWWYVRF